MASVVRRKPFIRYPFWYACFTDPRGRRLKKSTGFTSKSKAQHMALQWQRAADMARAGVLTADRAREVVSEILASVSGGDGLATFTARAWFEHFCKVKADAKDSETAAKYARVSRDFLAFIGDFRADRNIVAITSADVRAFRDEKKKSGITATTLNNLLSILSIFFNGAVRDHVISSNPCTAIEQVRDDVMPSKRRKKPFTIEQVRALLEVAEGDWQGLIRVAFYSGARLHDCARLRVSDLNLDAQVPTITFEKYSKHGDAHTVPCHPALADYFRARRESSARGAKVIEFPAAETFLFPSLAERRVTHLSKDFRRLMSAAGITNHKIRAGVVGKGQNAARPVFELGFHSLRRSHVSMLANAGVPEERRMALTGHSTRAVHEVYTTHEIARLHEAVTLLPSL
jgi:integrase